MSGTNGKQEHPEGDGFMGQLHKILKVSAWEADAASFELKQQHFSQFLKDFYVKACLFKRVYPQHTANITQ